MEQYLVIANFACHDDNEYELYANQWPVGIFESLDECYRHAREDLKQVGRDHYECILDTDEFDSAAEFELELENRALDYISEHITFSASSVRDSLCRPGHAEIIANDFECGDTNQRQIVKYMVYKLSVNTCIR